MVDFRYQFSFGPQRCEESKIFIDESGWNMESILIFKLKSRLFVLALVRVKLIMSKYFGFLMNSLGASFEMYIETN